LSHKLVSMSRFVAAGSDPGAPDKPVDDAWLQAQKLVESTKQPKKPVEQTQEGGKSLYEVLQANKGKTLESSHCKL
jgi:hypothetical protein